MSRHLYISKASSFPSIFRKWYLDIRGVTEFVVRGPNKSISLISSDKFPTYNVSNSRIIFSGSLILADFVGGNSDFFETAAKVVLFGFILVDVFHINVVDDDDISDAVVVAVGINLLLVRVVLPLDYIMN